MKRPLVIFWLGALCAGVAPAAESSAAPASFAIPQPGRRFEFPRDHGSHPEFKIEWWYITGHLWDEKNRRFGFQATFFRTAAPRRSSSNAPTSGTFGRDHLHLAHMALLDVSTGRFLHQERLNREGWDAGASERRLALTNGNWRLHGDSAATPHLRLEGTIHGDAAWRLNLQPTKPLVIFGTNGVSRKGATPEAASHYLTFPRLAVEGELQLGEETRRVRGQAWMDHEFSSSQLESDQAGWDWVSIQLNDGREVMAYRMRLKDGGTDEYSTLAWVDAVGSVTHQPANAFVLRPLSQWRSPRTRAEYPFGLQLEATDPSTGRPVRWRIEPLSLDQELPGAIGGVPYWEGASRVMDESGKEIGAAYIELTGYAGNLTERLR